MIDQQQWGYRQNVLAIIFKQKGEVFLWKNATRWQDRTFPKWWVVYEETHQDALFREILEETGLKKETLEIVYSFEIPFRKEFSQEEIEWKIKNKNEYFVGKEDYMFLVKYDGMWTVDLSITWELIEYKRVLIKDIWKYIDNVKLLNLINLDHLETVIMDQCQKMA